MACRRRRGRPVLLTGLVVVGLILSSCTSHRQQVAVTATPVRSSAPTESASAPGSTDTPVLAPRQYCKTDSDFQCTSITVPLDRTGGRPGTLRLNVEIEDPKPAPKGYLVFLAGGPGQGGASYAESLSERFPQVEKNYRWVSLDFRGTGAGAVHCPLLQTQLGYDDLTIPTVAAVQQCTDVLSPNPSRYSVTDTVADLDDVRRALGADKWALDGISYGTYIGERYTLAHPDNVSKLVLDSVVPHTGDEALQQTTLHAFDRVLTDICRQRRCPSDPVADLATVLKHRTDGATVSDAILEAGIYNGQYVGVPEALDAAAHGRPEKLDALIHKRAVSAAASKVGFLSQGTHAASLCADMTWPRSNRPDTTAAQRATMLAALARTRAATAFYPFTPAQAVGNGIAVTCEHWPASPAPVVPRLMPPVPTLLLGGSHDLSCPIEWLAAEAAVTPNKEVHIFANRGHAQQTWNGDPAAITVFSNFLDR